MVLRISAQALEQVRHLAQAAHPIEACGLIAAASGEALAHRVVPMRNQAASPTWFSFDPREQLQVWRELDQRDEDCRVIYHSHTASEAWPSREDIAHAGDAQVHYLIVSTWSQARHTARSFRIIDGQVFEEPLSVQP
ncbi:M67 family metallopeptidase [Pseudomonas sp. S75]|uniref:Mov34/MPN/PAD-1 family protein n=1 Tax=unclassified Pseudomonas TaxID=196821 RepID=UPI001907EA57|nr:MULTISPECIES: M67 family metallopeptidase [unclassified Pseudomonas]MBJ9977104.1 M67 family metallopeptidase [Pseudomonas sp. S30]MBK0154106.1 M67 family metallopeptidase [Pseudomonas sp. S75]